MAEAVQKVVAAAERESNSFGGFWEGLEANPAVENFVNAQLEDRPWADGG